VGRLQYRTASVLFCGTLQAVAILLSILKPSDGDGQPFLLRATGLPIRTVTTYNQREWIRLRWDVAGEFIVVWKGRRLTRRAFTFALLPTS